jgi:RNA polymerase sigma-70 factor, ECF subfamily
MSDSGKDMNADAITCESFSDQQVLIRQTLTEALAHLAADQDGCLLRLSRRLMGNEEDARDLLQDALLKAHLAIDDFRGEGSLAGWVKRIIINQGLKKLRHRSLVRRVSGMLSLVKERHYVPTTTFTGRASPEREASLREQALLLRSAMDKLSARQRTIFTLRYLEQMNIAEISDATGIGQGTVKTHLVRALRRIRAASQMPSLEVSDEQL